MHFTEAHGASLQKARELDREKELHHLRVYAHEDATAESPKWIVAHHSSENDDDPAQHEFDDGHEMLAHIAEHASVSNGGQD